MVENVKGDLIKILTIPVIVILGLLLTSCKPPTVGPCRPPRLGVQGIKDVVVSPKEEGIDLFTLNVKEGYFETYKASIKLYYANPSTLYSKTDNSLTPATFTSEFDKFENLSLYPVEGTTDVFLFKGVFCPSEPHFPCQTHYFLNEKNQFHIIKGDNFNSAFKVDNGYYFSSISLLFGSPILKYASIVTDHEENTDNIKGTSDDLLGLFEKYPYDTGFQPKIVLRDGEKQLSNLYMPEGGNIFDGENYAYFQASNWFDGEDVLHDPSALSDINSYLFIGKVSVVDYSMNITDVRYIKFKDPSTFTVVDGVEYFSDIGFVVYTREYPKKITTTPYTLGEIKDKVTILDPENFSTIKEKEISYNGQYPSKKLSSFSFFGSPYDEPSHLVEFDKANKRIISGIENKLSIVDLYSLNVSTVTLPDHWKVGAGNTGVWVDGSGNIWVVAYGGMENLLKQTTFKASKSGTLVPVKLKYAVFRIYKEGEKYTSQMVGNLE